MNKYNVIIVYHDKEDKILMCKREKEPFKGKLNFVGGKVEDGESKVEAAYRELEEETGITSQDIVLENLMNFEYVLDDFELEVYAGKLKRGKELREEVNHLLWIDRKENFFDSERFAGEGNIGHMLRQVDIHKKKLWN